MELSERQWEPFFISSMFPVPKRGKRIVNKDHIEGKKPLVSSIGNNNGVTNFIGNTKKVRVYNKCISIANGGSSAGKAFYEPFEFIASDHVTHCKNDGFTENQYLALSALISGKLTEKYSFSREITDHRISREKVMLPVNDAGEPDFDFLEQYISELKNKLSRQYLDYSKRKIGSMQSANIPTLDEKEWKDFFVAGEDGVFDADSTSSGADKNKLNLTEGEIPYITRSNEQNGISLFISEEQATKWQADEGNTITIGLDTQTVFYQPHKYYTGQNIQVIRHEKMNEYIAMFIISMLKVQMKNFNWGGNGVTLGRLCRTKMMLPVNDSGEPDFDYMEQYIKNQMVKKYKDYIAYSEK